MRDATTGHISHVEWVEGPTKTRQGGLHKRPRPVVQKLMRTGGCSCPVACFETLISKRPAELQTCGPLYLAPLRKERDWAKTRVWFARQPVGVNAKLTMSAAILTHSEFQHSTLYGFRVRAR